MKQVELKRLIVKEKDQASERVREEAGPNAVVLESKACDEGFELLVATNFDHDLLNDLLKESAPEPPTPQITGKNGGDSTTELHDASTPETDPRLVDEPALTETRGQKLMDFDFDDDIPRLRESLEAELEHLRAYREKRRELDAQPDVWREEAQAELFMLRKALKKELVKLKEYQQQRAAVAAEPDPDTVRLQAQLSVLQQTLEQEVAEISAYRQQRIQADAETDPITRELQLDLQSLQKSLSEELSQLETYKQKRAAIDEELDPQISKRWMDLAELQTALSTELSQLCEYRLQRAEIDAQNDPASRKLQQELSASHEMLRAELSSLQDYRQERQNFHATSDPATRVLQKELGELQKTLAAELKDLHRFREAQENYQTSIQPATEQLHNDLEKIQTELKQQISTMSEYSNTRRQLDAETDPKIRDLCENLTELKTALENETLRLTEYQSQRAQADAEAAPQAAAMQADMAELQNALRGELSALRQHREEREANAASLDPLTRGVHAELANLQRSLREELVQIKRQRASRDDEGEQWATDILEMKQLLAEEVSGVNELRAALKAMQDELKEELEKLKAARTLPRAPNDDQERQPQYLTTALTETSDQTDCLEKMQAQQPSLNVVQPASMPEELQLPDFAADVLTKMLARVPGAKDQKHDWRTVMKAFALTLKIGNDEILSKGGIVAILGSTGVGKTTTVAKLASRYIERHGEGRVAMITTDAMDIGSAQLLTSFAADHNLPLEVVKNPEELATKINKLASNDSYDLILIDTAGMSHRDLQLADQIRSLLNNGTHIDTYLALSATSGEPMTNEVFETFERIPLTGAIVTKVDEASSLGSVMSGVIRNDLRLSYLCDGKDIKRDINLPTRTELVKTFYQLRRQGTFSALKAEQQELEVS